MCAGVENVSALLLHRDAPYITHLIPENDFTNAGGSRLLTNLQPQVRERVYCYLYPEQYCMDTVEVMDSGSADEGDSMDPVEMLDSGSADEGDSMDPVEMMDSGSADEADSMDPVEVMDSGSADEGDSMDTIEVMDSGSADEADSMDPVEMIDSGSDEWDQYVDQDNDQDEDEVDEESDAMICYKRRVHLHCKISPTLKIAKKLFQRCGRSCVCQPCTISVVTVFVIIKFELL